MTVLIALKSFVLYKTMKRREKIMKEYKKRKQVKCANFCSLGDDRTGRQENRIE